MMDVKVARSDATPDTMVIYVLSFCPVPPSPMISILFVMVAAQSNNSKYSQTMADLQIIFVIHRSVAMERD